MWYYAVQFQTMKQRSYGKAISHRWITQAEKMEFIVININALPELKNILSCMDHSLSVLSVLSTTADLIATGR